MPLPDWLKEISDKVQVNPRSLSNEQIKKLVAVAKESENYRQQKWRSSHYSELKRSGSEC